MKRFGNVLCLLGSPLTPGSPVSDLNPVIRTNCTCSVKYAEAAWNYKSGRHSALLTASMWKLIFVEYPPVSGQQGDSIGNLTQFPLDQTHPFLKGFFY